MHSILTIVGARPQFIKAAVLSRLIRTDPFRDVFREILVHTGQHYDDNMSSVFFREMMIPEPDVNLGVGSGSHGSMTGAMLEKIERMVLELKPDLVLVYGDTNSTLAGALAASKLHVLVAHVEAGLRSRNKEMPEEQNRIIADHLAALLFCPTESAVRNLEREGFVHRSARGRSTGGVSPDSPLVANVGDIMLDAFRHYRRIVDSRCPEESALVRFAVSPPFRLLTMHRAENTDDAYRFASIMNELRLVDDVPIVFPMHPRTRKRITDAGISLGSHIRVIDPVGYLDMLELEGACEAVITDSGGVQKEAYFASKPCFTLRAETEWVETLQGGWNRLLGADFGELGPALRGPRPHGSPAACFGDGRAGEKMLALLRDVMD